MENNGLRLTNRTISHDEARTIQIRFNNSHFRQKSSSERAHYSIPADPERDDDLLLIAYIKQQEAKDAELAALRAENSKLRERAEGWKMECIAWRMIDKAQAEGREHAEETYTLHRSMAVNDAAGELEGKP